MTTAHPELDGLGNYEYGWADKTDAGATAKRGINEDVVRDISAKKNEPQWMLDLRLKGLSLFEKKPMPSWGSDLSGIFFDTIKYFVRSTEKQATTWDDLPDDIKNTYDRLGIPEAEKQRLVSGVAAQYESEVVYHSIREDLEKLGILLKRSPNARFVIEGHSDSFGPDDYNLTLSKLRAESVKIWLIDMVGIPAESITTVGLGKTRLVAPATGSIEEQRVNRRVEIVIKDAMP